MACEFTLTQIIEATGGKALSAVAEKFTGVGTDTREDLSGQIFVALQGDVHDAHQFLDKAVAKGAKCLLIHGEPPGLAEILPKITVVQVRSTLTGLQDLAKHWRSRLKTKFVGITGSNGKTSTKEFANIILKERFSVHASIKSFNNHWGVPMSILATPADAQIALIEMGMNHPGELTELSKICKPDVVLCTSVGRAHMGFFSGGLQEIADAKEEIYLANPKAMQIFNYDNEFTNKMFDRVQKLLGPERVRSFSSFVAGAEVSFRATHMNVDSLHVVGHIGGIKGEAIVPVFGRQNVVNLMAAASIGVVFNMEPELIWLAMKKCTTAWGRNQLLTLENGTRVLFDGYNANPDSMIMLIKNLFEIPVDGKKVAVLAEMLELGSGAGKAHYELGEMLSNTDFEVVWFYGPSARLFETGFKSGGSSKTVIISDTYEESIAKKVQAMLNPSDIVVLKGSRGMRLEKVMQVWDSLFKV